MKKQKHTDASYYHTKVHHALLARLGLVNVPRRMDEWPESLWSWFLADRYGAA